MTSYLFVYLYKPWLLNEKFDNRVNDSAPTVFIYLNNLSTLLTSKPICDMQVGEYQFYRDQLWTAPELLRMTTRPINGTQKADVYSFAIILQEIMFRAEPYFIDIDPPQSVYQLQLIYQFAQWHLCRIRWCLLIVATRQNVLLH